MVPPENLLSMQNLPGPALGDGETEEKVTLL